MKAIDTVPPKATFGIREYLASRDVPLHIAYRVWGVLGKEACQLYFVTYNHFPGTRSRWYNRGAARGFVYTERDIPLLDTAWGIVKNRLGLDPSL